MAQRIAVLVLVGLLAGCAGPRPTGESGVAGHVWVGPMCPVVRAGEACPDAPLEADLVVEDPAGRTVARSRSGADGAYRIALDPGSYVMVPQSPPAGLPFADRIPFEVAPLRWTPLDLSYDSGIR